MRLGERRRGGGFGQHRARGDSRGRSVPQRGDDLTLGVEQQLRGDGLELEAVEGEGGGRSPSTQRARVQQQRDGSYNLSI